MEYSSNTFPIQKVPLVKKDEAWKKACVDSIISRSSSGPTLNGQDRRSRMKIAYELYNSNFDEKDFKHVTDPFGVGDTFPSKMQNYNIVRPKIDLLMGEESKRPFTFKVIQTNDEAVGQMQSEYKKMILQYLVSTLNQIDQPDEAQQGEQPEDYLADLQKYMKYSYKNIAEDTAYNALNYLKEKLNLTNEFLKGWKDALVAGEELYYVGVLNGEPVFERVNPLYSDYDRGPDIEFIDQSAWFKRTMHMSPSSIYDRYYNKLKEEDLDKILELSKGNKGMTNAGTGGIKWVDSIPLFNNNEEIYDSLEVTHTTWSSYKRIGFMTYIDDAGQEQMTVVDENYDNEQGNKIEWEWITEIWEGYRIGTDIYFGIQPVEFQHQSVDALYENKIPYTGAVYSNTNSNGKSLLEIMKPLQYMYLVLWYRLDIALARDKGKALLVDITQIPKSMGVNTEKFLHYVSSTGVIFINPYEEGWDIPGREGGKPASFNQFSSVDLSMSNVIAGYIQLMAKIEDMIGEISGVTRQRQGQIQKDELVGNVQQNIIQSSHITEPLFWKHNQVKRRSLNMLIDTCKHAWENSGKKYLHFVLPDMTRIFGDIGPEFLYADLDVFVVDSTKEDRDLQALRTLLQPAMQSGATLAEAAEVATGDSLLHIKRKLAEIDERRAKVEQQQFEMEQESKRQQIEMQQANVAETNRISEANSIRQSETAINVALINADAKQAIAGEANIYEDKNGIRDSIDLARLELDKDKQQLEAEHNRSKLAEEARRNRVAEQQRNKELSIKQKMANRPTSTSKSK
jgi:hypothetical protein